MTKWFKCGTCSKKCTWRDTALQNAGILKESDGKIEIHNVLCPSAMKETTFTIWCSDDVHDAVLFMNKWEGKE